MKNSIKSSSIFGGLLIRCFQPYNWIRCDSGFSHTPSSIPILHNVATSSRRSDTFRRLPNKRTNFLVEFSHESRGWELVCGVFATEIMLTEREHLGCWAIEKNPSMWPRWVHEDPVARGIHADCSSSRLRLAISEARRTKARGRMDCGRGSWGCGLE